MPTGHCARGSRRLTFPQPPRVEPWGRRRQGRISMNHLYYGDNLSVLRDSIASDSVDLIYLDPPFNSNPGPDECRLLAKAHACKIIKLPQWT